MHPFRLALVLVAVAALLNFSSAALAAGAALSDDDCRQILERWAADRESVPQALVDACRERIAAAPVVEEAPVPPVAALDPCTGPDAATSVLCWGPWAALAPAAGPSLPPALAAVAGIEVDCRSEVAAQCETLLVPLEAAICLPGAPCGFATVVEGISSSADAEDTRFARIALLPDGSAFVIEAEDLAAIESVNGMTVVLTPRLTDDYENLRASGRDGDLQSRIVARVVRNEAGELLLAADIWGHGDRTGTAQSGYFAWGVASSQASLDALRTGSASLQFSGPLSVDNATIATLQVDFGGSPAWSGSWNNPAWNFSAGGTVSGVDLISQPGQFSANVVAQDSLVQGALLGEQGSRALAHIIDVNLVEQGRIRDVGLLREVGGVLPASEIGL